MPNPIPIEDHAWHIVQILTRFCSLFPCPVCAARSARLGIQGCCCLESTVAQILLWSLPFPRAGSILLLPTSGWCYRWHLLVLMSSSAPEITSAVSPCSARCPYKDHLSILWVPRTVSRRIPEKLTHTHRAFPLRQVSQCYRAAVIPTRMLQQMQPLRLPRGEKEGFLLFPSVAQLNLLLS